MRHYAYLSGFTPSRSVPWAFWRSNAVRCVEGGTFAAVGASAPRRRGALCHRISPSYATEESLVIVASSPVS